MISWITKRSRGTKGQGFNGMGKEIAILSFFTRKPLRGGRRIRLQDYGMRVGIGVRQVRVLQQLLLAILRSCTLLPIQVEFQKLLTPFQPGSLMR